MKNTFIIGITGGTGSGKTTMVNDIINQLPSDKVCVISQDSYYKATDNLTFKERSDINFDHPDAIDFNLLVNQINDLKLNKTITQPVYSFVSHNRIKETVIIHPKKIIILEGILIFHHKKLRDVCDVKVFVDADADERLIRRVKRDTVERGRDVDEVFSRYINTLKPMHKQFIEPAKKYADIIIPNNQYNTIAIDIVRTVISEHL